ncbi:hypothetical protein HB852_00150 [Listeria grandensis]|nr:hypothetical protein [Listeria grandensis]EUJ24960.1 hypothetical protein PGRAN_03715 [Listeria grandensis FSL F6-0971]MBC1473026.1 hypothetical protein [Listeria grandensis]
MPIIIIILVLGYFIYQQFEYEKIRRITYVAIPIFAIYQITQTLPDMKSGTPIFVVVLVFILGAAIGLFQASAAKVKESKTQIGFTQVAGKELPVYKKEVLVKGGMRYLLGWVGIILAKFLLAFLLHLNIHESMVDAFVHDALKDMFFFLSFAQKEGATAWMDWTLIGISSAVYSLRLMQKYPLVKAKLGRRNNHKE